MSVFELFGGFWWVLLTVWCCAVCAETECRVAVACLVCTLPNTRGVLSKEHELATR